MKAIALVEDLERRGVRLRVEGEQLIVDAPIGVLTKEIKAALTSKKDRVLRLLAEEPRTHRPLAEYAADRLPAIKFTIRETGEPRDFELLGWARKIIEEFQPGGNHVYLTIVTLDGRRVVVEWRAVADRGLRLGLARLLAQHSRPERA